MLSNIWCDSWFAAAALSSDPEGFKKSLWADSFVSWASTDCETMNERRQKWVRLIWAVTFFQRFCEIDFYRNTIKTHSRCLQPSVVLNMFILEWTNQFADDEQQFYCIPSPHHVSWRYSPASVETEHLKKGENRWKYFILCNFMVMMWGWWCEEVQVKNRKWYKWMWTELWSSSL